jgi:hypothetical protein
MVVEPGVHETYIEKSNSDLQQNSIHGRWGGGGEIFSVDCVY